MAKDLAALEADLIQRHYRRYYHRRRRRFPHRLSDLPDYDYCRNLKQILPFPFL